MNLLQRASKRGRQPSNTIRVLIADESAVFFVGLFVAHATLKISSQTCAMGTGGA